MFKSLETPALLGWILSAVVETDVLEISRNFVTALLTTYNYMVCDFILITCSEARGAERYGVPLTRMIDVALQNLRPHCRFSSFRDVVNVSPKTGRRQVQLGRPILQARSQIKQIPLLIASLLEAEFREYAYELFVKGIVGFVAPHVPNRCV
jgi:hypothetical protein